MHLCQGRMLYNNSCLIDSLLHVQNLEMLVQSRALLLSGIYGLYDNTRTFLSMKKWNLFKSCLTLHAI